MSGAQMRRLKPSLDDVPPAGASPQSLEVA